MNCLWLLICVTVIGKIANVNTARSSIENTRYVDTWKCHFTKCIRSPITSHNETIVSLQTCRIMCPTSPSIWPKPTSVELANKQSTTFHKEHLMLKTFGPKAVQPILETIANVFLQNIESYDQRLVDGDEQVVKLNLHARSNETKLALSTDESYELYVQHFEDYILINIYGANYFGIRHGLETLSQLIWFDVVTNKSRIIHDVKIKDQPAFPHRGLLVDTARNFFPIPDLKKVVDGMSFTKLNTLHLHLTDTVSFPMILPHFPHFARDGAYSPSMTYSPEDIEELIDYAAIRGVKVILEIDSPSHVNKGWPKNLIMCDESDFFDTVLNPDNPETLNVLQGIYEDLFQLGTDKEIFHIGGDEVNLDCWRDTRAAQLSQGPQLLWLNFTSQILLRLKAANNGSLPSNVVIWSSPLTDHYIAYFPFKENIVVQYWFGNYQNVIENGFKIIFSTVGQWYLDCGFGPWKMYDQNGPCDPYVHWRTVYEYRPWNKFDNYSQVLGGEACLWSEQVSPDDLETRLWPRAAAFAERLWSDPEFFDKPDVFNRLALYSERLKARGIRVAAFWPMYCTIEAKNCW